MNTVHLPTKKRKRWGYLRENVLPFSGCHRYSRFLTVYITGRELLDLSVISQMNFVQSHSAEVYRHKKAHWDERSLWKEVLVSNPVSSRLCFLCKLCTFCYIFRWHILHTQILHTSKQRDEGPPTPRQNDVRALKTQLLVRRLFIIFFSHKLRVRSKLRVAYILVV